ncbi:MAG: DUF488 domain-containing protein [Chloroflexota bacterium]|nr:DUF488 domain-containing protein [Chloroflexota bacterium]
MMLIYPVGYSAHGAAIAEIMQRDERALLIDTRLSPASRWPAWTRDALQTTYGSRYRYAGTFLGNVTYRSGGPIHLADAATGLRGLRRYLEHGYHLVLLCGCRDYERCHRKVIVDLLKEQLPTIQVIQPETDAFRETLPCLSVRQPMEDAYHGIAGVPYPWQSHPELKAAVQAYLAPQGGITPQQGEAIRAYCLSVIKAPCYYETQAEEERQALETCLEHEVQTAETLRQWVREAVRFGIDPFECEDEQNTYHSCEVQL